MASNLNLTAKTFKSLHKPHHPVILANVYDGISAKTIASLPSSKAIATASYAIAEAAGTSDEALTLEENIRATKIIASVIKDSGKPLTVDIQDGYGEQLEDSIKQVIEAGAVGVNLEDFDKERKQFYSASDAVDRIKRVLATATALGVPDFVVNARADALVYGGAFDEVVSRGHAFLDAGATTVFVMGPMDRPVPGSLTKEEIAKLVEAFEGRVNVTPGLLPTKEVAALGVSRISVGPGLQFAAVGAIKQAAEQTLDA
ncbi:isocitrate lyase/PEP mutase family protein [Aspergillus puulaauensis]|uniref:Phosphoenolpyruvate/pyruvate domain-containing protein n=1 Tax=Aspergillus puulaauensis TaxID=1220207 RepID=A0A7R7XCC4_9EURO|nr:uncharacterized protein APUU_11479A [Aspergillus puulaauensis]BCS18651.1 hypothetical protein APUU_11479A [Aspergillus puulaauensis]